MTDSTPNSIIKVDSPYTSRFSGAQIIIFVITGFTMIRIIDDVLKLYKTNLTMAVVEGLTSLVFLVLVFLCARTDYTLYCSQRLIIFKLKRIFKRDEIYKFAENTTSTKAKRFTGLEYADNQGHLTFEKFRTFENGTCNRGFCYTVTPSDSRDIEAFTIGIERLYNSLPHGSIHKTIIAQSKTLTDLCAIYEERLHDPKLTIAVRAGLLAKKNYFQQIKDRVGWMYVIFVGIGYYVDDAEANIRINEVRETYNKFLTITGIKVTPVTDANEYALLYAQMYHMKDLTGVDYV